MRGTVSSGGGFCVFKFGGSLKGLGYHWQFAASES